MQLLEKILKTRTVNIFILTEGDAGGLFVNIMFTVLFIWLCMRILHIFYFN
jgi:hypothetical protein